LTRSEDNCRISSKANRMQLFFVFIEYNIHFASADELCSWLLWPVFVVDCVDKKSNSYDAKVLVVQTQGSATASSNALTLSNQ
jgi:hypothetical protein